MPFKSRSQQRLLFAKHPEVAEEFAEETPKNDYNNLPEHVDQKKGKNQHMKKLSKQYMRAKSVK